MKKPAVAAATSWQAKLWKFHTWFLLAAILAVALSVRLFRLQDLMIFTYDQGRDMYVLQAISRGDLTLLGPTTGLPGVFLGPYMYYFLLPGFLLSNGSPFGVTTWQLTMIVLSFSCFFLLLRPLVGKWWTLAGVLILSLTPGAIDQARTIWNPSLVVMTLLPSLAALVYSRQKPWLLGVSLFLYGLSLQTELAYTVFLAPIYGWWVLYYSPIWPWLHRLVTKKRVATSHKYSWAAVVIGIVAFGTTLLPQVLFELRHDFLITRSVLREMQDPTKQVPYQKVWAERPAQIIDELDDTLTGNIPGSALILLAVVASSGVLAWKYRQAETLLWVGYWWLPLVALMFHRGNYGSFFDYYITAHYLPGIAMIIILGAKLTAQHTKARWLSLGAVVTISLLIFAKYAAFIYDTTLFKYTAATQLQALRAARQLRPEPNSALQVFVPNLVPVAYQYLSEWMSRTGQAEPMDFGATTHSSYVLIIEPHISDGSKVAFKEWSEKWLYSANCQPAVTFGISSVIPCLAPQPDAALRATP